MHRRQLRLQFESDEELLEKILRSEKNARRIVEEIGLHRLSSAHQRELKLSDAAYERLMAAIELGRRTIQGKLSQKRMRISSSSDAIEFCRNHFATLIREAKQEEFHVVTLDTKNHVIDSHRVTVGTLDASLVHPREVFRVAIKDVSSSIILAHNHPSGDPTPSREDKAVTDRLTESGNLIGIDVLDHVVMASDGCISIREVS